MTYRISREEFAVLTFLHQNAEAYDQSCCFDLKAIGREIGLPIKEVKRAASYLSSMGMATLTVPEMLTFANEGDHLIFLTGNGENFMRELEDRLADELEKAPDENPKPGIAKKITLKIGGFIYDASKDIIVKVLTEFITTHHQ